jgi:hypothetical protein
VQNRLILNTMIHVDSTVFQTWIDNVYVFETESSELSLAYLGPDYWALYYKKNNIGM